MLLKKILVPLDGSLLSERTLPYTSDLELIAPSTLDHLAVVPVHPQRAESEKTLATSLRGER